MDRQTLREQWKANNHRPVWVREHREAINEHVDTSEPVPEGGTFRLRQWLDKYKGVVTRQLSGEKGGTE